LSRSFEIRETNCQQLYLQSPHEAQLNTYTVKDQSDNGGKEDLHSKIWQDFKTFTVGHNFEASQPGEEDFIAFFKRMRLEQKLHFSYYCLD
jgi:hypothetical protein